MERDVSDTTYRVISSAMPSRFEYRAIEDEAVPLGSGLRLLLHPLVLPVYLSTISALTILGQIAYRSTQVKYFLEWPLKTYSLVISFSQGVNVHAQAKLLVKRQSTRAQTRRVYRSCI